MDNKILYRFWSLIDISDNIRRVKQMVGNQHTKGQIIGNLTGALILAITATIFAVYCDFLPTYMEVQKWSGKMVESLNVLASQVGIVIPLAFVGIAGLLMTLFPTAVETFGIQYATAGISIFSILFYAMSLFDFATDNPVSKEFIAKYDFTAFGWFAPYAAKIFHVLWLFMSTYGFEAIAMVSWAAVFYGMRALWQEVYGKGRRNNNQNQSNHNRNQQHHNQPGKPKPNPRYEPMTHRPDPGYRPAFVVDHDQVVSSSSRPVSM